MFYNNMLHEVCVGMPCFFQKSTISPNIFYFDLWSFEILYISRPSMSVCLTLVNLSGLAKALEFLS